MAEAPRINAKSKNPPYFAASSACFIGENQGAFRRSHRAAGISMISMTIVQATSMIVIFGSDKLCEAGTRGAYTLRAAVPSPRTPRISSRDPPSRHPAKQSPAMKTAPTATAPLPTTPRRSSK